MLSAYLRYAYFIGTLALMVSKILSILKVKPSVIVAPKNDDSCHKGREGGGQNVMIEIIISVNDGQPLIVILLTVPKKIKLII